MNNIQSQFSDPQYIIRVNDSIETLSKKFHEIKSYKDQPATDDNFNNTFLLLLDIFDVIPLLKIDLINTRVVRGRPHSPKDPLINELWQLSFNWRFKKHISLGRFNQIGEPLFYCSLSTESPEIDYILTASLECCKELNIEYGAPDVQDITLGLWEIKRSFPVVILCFDDLHLKDNPRMNDAVNQYFNLIHKYFSIQAADFIEDFLRYFSKLSREITDRDINYQLTVPFFQALRHHYEEYNNYNEPIFGLVYPSAMTASLGLNLVLTREAVKSFLRLDKVVVYRFCLVKPECHTWVADKCSDIINVKSPKFRITNYIQPGRIRSIKY